MKLKHLFILSSCILCVGSFSATPIVVSQPALVADASDDEALERSWLLHDQAVERYKQGQYPEAISLAEESLSIQEKILGKDHIDIAVNLNILGLLHKAENDYAAALPLYERIVDIVEVEMGSEDAILATYLNTLATIHQFQDSYQAALPLYERALAIREKVLEEGHRHIGISLHNLASLHREMGEFAKALPLFERALDIEEKEFGKESHQVASTLNNLGLLQAERGNYEAALPLYERALAIRKTSPDIDSSLVASSLSNIGMLHKAKGAYSAALAKIEEAIAIQTEALDENHPDLARSWNNLASIYDDQSEFSKALPLYERALAINEAAPEGSRLEIASNLSNIAILYVNQGNYEAALPLYEKSLAITESKLDSDHPNVATILTNTASLYRKQKEYDKAIPLFKRALAIGEAALDPNHPTIASTLNSLATTYYQQANYAEALPLYERVLSIREDALETDHPDVAIALNNIAAIYQEAPSYGEALPLYERALAIQEAAFNLNNADVGRTLGNLATLHWAQDNVEQAIPLFTRASAIEEKALSDMIAGASENRRQRYINSIGRVDVGVTLALEENDSYQSASRLALTNILRRKGRVLDAAANTSQRLREQLSPESKALFDELGTVRSMMANIQFSNQGEKTVEQSRMKLAQLEESAEIIEEEIARTSAVFQAETAPVSIEAVQSLLPSDAALVEFVRYAPFDPKASAKAVQAPRYAAFVLLQDGTVHAVDLGEAEPIDQLSAKLQRAIREKSANHKDIASELNEQLIDPILPFIGNKTQLLLSPDSQLNVVPFDALVDQEGRYLIETYQISYLTSGRDLLKLQINQPSDQKAVVIANPDYGEIGNSEIEQQTETTQNNRQRSVDAQSLSFGALPGTAEEAKTIAPLLPDATIYTEARATESALKQVKAPSILHIATHGFFLPDVPFVTPEGDSNQAGQRSSRATDVSVESTSETDVQLTPSNLENPLLRSGLALAGFNQRSSGIDDGVFTALEAAGLNLYGTQLVVLSACETGLGAVSNGEGVYGLRRAFEIAGAQSQLMSLWRVDDAGTSELMRLYYENLVGKRQGRAEALRSAQLDMLNSSGVFSNPYYWSSFIFSGDWRLIEAAR